MGWGWYTCPMYDSCPYTRECQSLTWQEVGFGGGLMTFRVGSSLHKRGCLLWFDTQPPKSLLPTYPWSSSFSLKHPPSLVPGCQASSYCTYLSVVVPFCLHASTIDWACTSHRADLNLSHMEAMYTSTCLAEGASLLPTLGKTKLTRSLGLHPNIK